MSRIALIALSLVAFAAPALASGRTSTVAPVSKLTLSTPDNDDGRHIELVWEKSVDHGVVYVVHRSKAGASVTPGGIATPTIADGKIQLEGFEAIATIEDDTKFTDQVVPSGPWSYAVVAARPGKDKDTFAAASPAVIAGPIEAQTYYLNSDRWFFALIVFLMAAAFLFYWNRAKTHPESLFIRRIPGVDAIEEAVGRSTEMGRPVLYVTGTEEIQDMQTIASLLILGHVSQMTAEYDTELKVANFFPLTMVVAEEIVRQGFARAGRIDAHKPENVMFISAEQFAYAAGVNGLILRDKPATNIYLGKFFAESLILAETGYVTKAVQIAGTAENTQLPFFIAACDYTIIGEELYAVSAYMSREPVLVAGVKAGDFVKVLIIALVFMSAMAATFGIHDLGARLIP